MQLQSENIRELAAALAKAQAEFPPLKRDKSVLVKMSKGQYTFNFADFAQIREKVAPILAKYGLATSRSTVVEDGRYFVAVRLYHTSGQWTTGLAPIPFNNTIVDRDGTQREPTMQEIGSKLSYGGRYAEIGVIDVVAEDDDDANIADGNMMEARNNPSNAPSKPPVDFKPKTQYIGTLTKLIPRPKAIFLNLDVDGSPITVSQFRNKLPDGVTEQMMIEGEMYSFSYEVGDNKDYKNFVTLAPVPPEYRELVELRNKIAFSVTALAKKTDQEEFAIYQRSGHGTAEDFNKEDAEEFLKWLDSQGV